MIPMFGRAIIRRFSGNVSGMKKFAARDFEQVLKVRILVSSCASLLTFRQCAIPCFEGLLPEPMNSVVLTMLFELAQWHALAKLQLHSDTTIAIFQAATSTLGQAMRAFLRRVCSQYQTRELPRETQSRQRRQAAKAQAQASGVPTSSGSVAPAPKFKAFTVLNTPKYHRLGDHARAISETGTTDNKTTQMVRCCPIGDVLI